MREGRVCDGHLMVTRKQEEKDDTVLVAFLLFSLSFHSEPWSVGWCHPFRMGLPFLATPFWNHPCKHSEVSISNVGDFKAYQVGDHDWPSQRQKNCHLVLIVLTSLFFQSP